MNVTQEMMAYVEKKISDLDDYTIEFASEIDHRDLLAGAFEALTKLREAYTEILMLQMDLEDNL